MHSDVRHAVICPTFNTKNANSDSFSHYNWFDYTINKDHNRTSPSWYYLSHSPLVLIDKNIHTQISFRAAILFLGLQTLLWASPLQLFVPRQTRTLCEMVSRASQVAILVVRHEPLFLRCLSYLSYLFSVICRPWVLKLLSRG